jgi:hypothetical protein
MRTIIMCFWLYYIVIVQGTAVFSDSRASTAGAAADLSARRFQTRPEHFSGRTGFGPAWKNFCYFGTKKILPMTIPLDASGLDFRAGLGPGPGLGGPATYFIV